MWGKGVGPVRSGGRKKKKMKGRWMMNRWWCDGELRWRQWEDDESAAEVRVWWIWERGESLIWEREWVKWVEEKRNRKKKKRERNNILLWGGNKKSFLSLDLRYSALVVQCSWVGKNFTYTTTNVAPFFVYGGAKNSNLTF